MGGHQRSFELIATGPFRLDLTAWALRRRPSNRVDRWHTDRWAGSYSRTLLIDGEAATVVVTRHTSDHSSPPDATPLSVTVTMATAITDARGDAAASLLERLLGTDVDLTGFYELVREDSRLAPLAERFRGVHPPRFPTLFEALANAIANQQLSLEVGIELLNRLTDAHGAPGLGPNDMPSAAFPTAEAMAGVTTAELRELGFSTAKSGYLIGAAEAVASGELRTGELEAMDRATATGALMSLRGIGRWSAEYVLLRGLGRLEVYPADDVGARNKLQRFLGLPARPDREEILAIVDRWRPYAGMVYFHLLLDGLADSGALAEPT